MATALLQVSLPQQYLPAGFALPWWAVPWVPSASLATCVVLLGAYVGGGEDYKRLGYTLAAAVGHYLLFGVHTSYLRFKGRLRAAAEVLEDCSGVRGCAVRDGEMTGVDAEEAGVADADDTAGVDGDRSWRLSVGPGEVKGVAGRG